MAENCHWFTTGKRDLPHIPLSCAVFYVDSSSSRPREQRTSRQSKFQCNA